MAKWPLVGLIFCGILCSCGIKGRPLPPETNIVNINQLQSPVEPTSESASPSVPAKTGKEVKKTNKKK